MDRHHGRGEHVILSGQATRIRRLGRLHSRQVDDRSDTIRSNPMICRAHVHGIVSRTMQ